MSDATKLWTYVEVYNKYGNAIGEYWMNYHDATERAALGMRAADAITEGGGVFTVRVSANGAYPMAANKQ